MADDLRAPDADPGRSAPAGEDPGRVAQRHGRRVVGMAFVFYAALGGAAVLWRTVWGGESLLYVSEVAAERGIDWLPDLAAGLLAAGLVVLVSWEVTRRTRSGAALARALARAIGPVPLPHCLVLALLSGVAEEAFFRGALQPRTGLLAASLLFGLAHFVPRREFLPWTAFSVVVGVLLGVLFEQTGNLLAPVVTHIGVNAVNLPLLVRRYGEPGAA
ncbi:MAG: CPBP family intramembrane metalloprotease [Deltaproteobacteria bacterium]|nr:MAG: CPBP family intramembrane metalloprotease [Deltaproteobacteria bacterium]